MMSDVKFQDGRYVSEVEIVGSSEEADLRPTDLFDRLVKNDLRQRFLDTGILSFHFDVPQGASHVQLKAIFTSNGESVETRIDVQKKYSTNDEYIKLWTTSDDLEVGDYASFHVTSNFSFDVFYILVSIVKHTDVLK